MKFYLGTLYMTQAFWYSNTIVITNTDLKFCHCVVTRWGNNGNNERLYFLGLQTKSLQMVTAAMKLKRCLLLGRKAMTNLDSILKSRDITLCFQYKISDFCTPGVLVDRHPNCEKKIMFLRLKSSIYEVGI